jgi:hypothetical protein
MSAFEEVDDGLWTIRLATVTIGRYDARLRRIQPIAPLTEGRSASSAGSAPDQQDKKPMIKNLDQLLPMSPD